MSRPVCVAAGDNTPTGGDPAAVYGDAAYRAGEVLEQLEDAGIEAMMKV